MSSERDYKDLLETVLTTARKAAEQHGQNLDAQSRAMAFAYCDVLDAAMTQARVLGVDLSDLGLADFDPYAVIGGKQAA
jgi:hypothetical protein